MIDAQAKVNQSDLDRLIKGLPGIARNMRKDMPSLIRQTMYFAIVSAAKATEPGTTSKISKLPKKYKLRPLVKLPSEKGYYYLNPNTGYTIKSDRPIRNAGKRGLKKITKAIKKWNKSAGKFDYIPYSGSKRDETDKRFKIPYAGAAKAGYLKALHSIGKTSGTDTIGIPAGKKYSTVQSKLNGFEQSLSVINLVDYTSITSPDSAQKGLDAAAKRMLKIYEKKLENAVKRI